LDKKPRDCGAFCCLIAVRKFESPSRSRGREESAGLAGEAAKDGFAGRDFDEMEDGEGEQNQDDVGEPWIQGGKMKSLGHMVGVEELEDVEVEEVEAVATFTDKKKRAPGEERGDGMGTAEAKDESSEDGGHEAAVYEEVGGVADEGVEEESDGDEAGGGEDEALACGEDEGMLQFAEGDAGEEGANVGQWSVLEEADELR
jgi:hypothetical protein